MKRTKKVTLWYNPGFKDEYRPLRQKELSSLAADREGRALLESYCRLYNQKL